MNKLFLGPGVLSSSPNRCFNDTPGSRYTFTTRPFYIVKDNIKTIRYDILTPFCFSDYRDMVRATDLLENWVGQHAIPQIVLATCREKHSSLKTDVLVSSGHNHFLRCLVTVLNLPFQEITRMSAFGRLLPIMIPASTMFSVSWERLFFPIVAVRNRTPPRPRDGASGTSETLKF